MILKRRGPVIVTIAGFGAIVLTLAGLMIG